MTPSLPLTVLMTVTEVTTQIVSAADIIGLSLVSRAQVSRRHEARVAGTRRFAQPRQLLVVAAILPLGLASLRRSGAPASRALGLVVKPCAVGVSVGLGPSLALVAALGALGLGG